METKKKPAKPDYVSFADIFPWLRFQPKLTEAQKTKRDAMELKRKKMEKAHPRANSKAYCFIDQRTTATERTLNYADLGNQNFKYPGIRDARFWEVFSDFILFIDSADLDKAQRKAYEKWLDGKTRPLIPGVKAASCPSDYARFYDSYVHGRTAIIHD